LQGLRKIKNKINFIKYILSEQMLIREVCFFSSATMPKQKIHNIKQGTLAEVEGSAGLTSLLR